MPLLLGAALLLGGLSLWPRLGHGNSQEDETWLRKEDRCWRKIPGPQRKKLQTILRSWPARIREQSRRSHPAFPCNIVLAVSWANKKVHAHIQSNPLDLNYAYDPGDRKSWPGYQADRKLATMWKGAGETLRPRADTTRRDCIGMQTVVHNALSQLPSKDVLIQHAMLVAGNISLGRFPAKWGSYALGLNPIDAGVHHVVGMWPVLSGVPLDPDRIPEYSIILDYWPAQDADDPTNIMSKAEFLSLWDGLNEAGPLRPDE